MRELRDGAVDVLLSPIFCPVEELIPRRGAIPRPRCIDAAMRQLDAVEHLVQANSDRLAVARSSWELQQVLESGRTAIVHCLEGGYHLGAEPKQVDDTVSLLARSGVAYITLAHLFWWSVAGNVPALPFLSDGAYRRLFPQPDVGLTVLGRQAVRAMVREGVLVDLTHMSSRAARETLDLLDDIDPDRAIPVMATHTTSRAGSLTYGLADDIVIRVGQRAGVIGLIACEHYISDGIASTPARSLAESARRLAIHIDRIEQLTGSGGVAALGTDLDGYIKPSLAGIRTIGDLRALREALVSDLGEPTATAVMGENAMRVLLQAWGQKPEEAHKSRWETSRS